MSQKRYKSSKTRKDTAVQGTNDNSSVSKSSLVDRGYFHDDFISHLVNKKTRRSPLINRGYYVRAKAINRCFQQFLNHHKGHKTQTNIGYAIGWSKLVPMLHPFWILCLGAGYDSAFFRLKAERQLTNTVYVEIDFPDLARKKASLIQKDETLRQLVRWSDDDKSIVAQNIVINSQDYKLVGVDLTQLPLLEACLRAIGIQCDIPTMLLSEVVLTYMTPKSSSAVIAWCAEYFQRAMFVTYEQIHPNDAFGLFMLGHFQRLGSPLRCIRSFPNASTQANRYTSRGWDLCYVCDMNAFYSHCLPAQERHRVEGLEPFDEYEEWHLKCSHYILLCATKATSLAQLPPQIYSGPSGEKDQKQIHISTRETSVSGTCVEASETKPVKSDHKHSQEEATLAVQYLEEQDDNFWWHRRFGHRVVQDFEGHLIVIGGFGEHNGGHCRIREVSVIDMKTMAAQHLPCVDKESGTVKSDMLVRFYHTATCISTKKLLVIGGRTSPTKPVLDVVLMEITSKIEENQSVHSEKQKAHLECASLEAQRTRCSNMPCESNEKNLSNLYDPINQSQTAEQDTLGQSPSAAQTMPASGLGGGKDLICKCTSVADKGAIPSARWRHAAVLVQIKGQECVVIHGGRNSTSLVLDDWYSFNIADWHWAQIAVTGDHAEARHSHSLSVWNNRLIIAGGMGSDLRPLASVFMVDTENWMSQSLPLAGQLLPRYGHTAHIVGDKLLLVGGVSQEPCPLGVACIDLKAGVCQEYALPVADPERLLMLHNHASAVVTSDTLLVLGGGGSCFSFGTHLNATPVYITLPTGVTEPCPATGGRQ